MRCAFWKFSTAGNTTLFLDQPLNLRDALLIIPAEQAGYADLKQRHMQMAGGELCINATIAFAALAEMLGVPCHQLETAGQIIACGATGQKPMWQAWIDFDLGVPMHSQPGGRGEIMVMHLPGISHALIECRTLPESGQAGSQARILLENMGLANKAAGIVWWRHCGEEVEILPVVAVPDAGTFNLEGACGSASLAVSLAQSRKKGRIRQPSGEYLTVEISNGCAHIEAPVTMLANGNLW